MSGENAGSLNFTLLSSDNLGNLAELAFTPDGGECFWVVCKEWLLEEDFGVEERGGGTR